jgi:hypothetical protein
MAACHSLPHNILKDELGIREWCEAVLVCLHWIVDCTLAYVMKSTAL